MTNQKSFKLAICFCLMLGTGLAQSAYTYNNESSDGTNVYATGVIQSSAWYGALDAVHTYSQSVRITSPSGRTNSCGFSNPAPATQAVNYQCEAVLPVEDGSDYETGDYNIVGQQTAVCSQVGTFTNVPFQIPLSIYLAQTYLQGGYAVSGGCYYPSLACSSGTPTCSEGWTLGFGSSCSYYAWAKCIVYKLGSGPNSNPPICTKVGFAGGATGPGPCY